MTHTKLIQRSLFVFIFLAAACLRAETAASKIQAELKSQSERIHAAMFSNANVEFYEKEMAMLEKLLDEHPERDADRASILITKANLLPYISKSEQVEKLLTEIVADYPTTQAATQAKRQLKAISDQRVRNSGLGNNDKIAALIGKTAPEINFIWSTRPGLKSLSQLKGNVVVLDFWATWCGPCIAAFPKVREEVAHFKGYPVVFLGVSSIQGRVKNVEEGTIDTKGDPEKELSLTPLFIKKHNVTWDIAFSEQNVFNPDYDIKGIPYVTIIAPDGTVAYAGLNPVIPQAEIGAKVLNVLKKFNLPHPEEK